MRDGCPFPRGKGAGLPSRAACEGRLPSPLSPPQSRGPSLPSSSERRGGLAATSLAPVPLSPTPPRPDAGAGSQLWARSLLPPQCLVSPGPLRPPCCGRVRAPGVGGAEMLSLRLRGLHGRILFPRCHWATWREGREDGGRTFSPRLGQPPCPRRHSVITGKENCFKKLPC